MPIKPEEIDASTLPVALIGYKREAVDELLKRVAWDYRQATRAQESWAKDERRLKDRILELETQLAAAEERFAQVQSTLEDRFQQELRRRSNGAAAELEQLRAKVAEHEGRDEMTRALLATAQRTSREMREATRAECEGLLKAAQRRAREIEAGARTSLRHTASEVERLRRLELDLKDQLRSTLESVLGKDGEQDSQDEQGEQQAPPVAVD